MTLESCYAAMGADYQDVLSRLRSERLVQRFVLKFLDDKSFELLQSSLAQGNTEEAFRAAHTIKGMCQNLSFTQLECSSTALTEDLRAGGSDRVEGLFAQVQADYARTVEAITAYRDQPE